MTWIRNVPFRIAKFFNRFVRRLSPEERRDLMEEISKTASPGFDFFLLVIISCSIATLGLITNSAAVIIGAMLLAPLMSPIIGLGLGSISGEEDLIKKSASALFRGAVLAILLSTIMTLVNRFLPFVSLQELPAEVIARTRPSPIDLMIALAGGFAAAYAMTRPNLSAALPGVAIATALMPPLCTIGIGIALNRWDVAGGASLLFITNAITIAFATAFIFFVRGFSVEARKNAGRFRHSLTISLILIIVLLIPLTYYSVKFFHEASQNRLINSVVTNEVNKLTDANLVDLEIIHLDEKLDMVITIRTSASLEYAQVVKLQESIVNGLQMPVSLKVDQIIAKKLDPLIPPTPTWTPTPTLTPTPTATNTPGPSPTSTSTNTPTATASATPTATPAIAMVGRPTLPALQLYQSPGGPVIGKIKTGQQLTVLFGEAEFNGIVWVEVMDEEGRIGWLPKTYLLVVTATSTPAP
mgnify:CR=1 FL=1